MYPFTSGSSSQSGWKYRSEEHTSELQSQSNLVCRLLLEKKKRPHAALGHFTLVLACSRPIADDVCTACTVHPLRVSPVQIDVRLRQPRTCRTSRAHHVD